MRPCKNVPKKSCEGLSTEGGIFSVMSMPLDGEYYASLEV